MEATPKERIEQLQTSRVDLVRRKTALEKKLAELVARRGPDEAGKSASGKNPSQVE